MSAVAEPLPEVVLPDFELQFTRRGMYKKSGKWVEVPGRAEELDMLPTLYTPLSGPYPVVAAEAVRLNEIQLRASYLDYLFWADLPVADKSAPTPTTPPATEPEEPK